MATTKTTTSKKTTDESTMKAGGNYFLVDPSTVKKGKQSRYFDHSEDDIMAKVKSYENDGGQLTPVTCRQLSDKSLELFDGFCRLEAALKYNELHPDKPMKLKVIVTGDSGEKAYIKGMVNNHSRKTTSVVDDAFAFKALREDYGWKDKEIAETFGTNATKVSLCKKITTLRDKILKLIHSGELAFDTAVALADFNDSTQDEILAKSEAYKAEQHQKYEQRVSEWMKDAAEIDAVVPPTPAENDGKETPAKPNNAKPGGKPAKPTKPTKPETTTNKAVKETIRAKQAEAAEAGETKPKTTGRPGAGGTIKAPTFSDLKTFLKEDFIDVKNAAEPAASIFEILMEYMMGKIAEAKAVKDIKTECARYELKSTAK